MYRLVLAIAALLTPWAGSATDLPFGADTLPHLIANSDLIVRGPVASALPAMLGSADDSYALHAVSVRSALKGPSLAQSRVPFLVHSYLPVAPGASSHAIVFLMEIDAATANAIGTNDSIQHIAVSGGYGVVDIRPAGRLAAISSLIDAGQSTASLRAWAAAHLTSRDMLLQRSSLQVLYENLPETWAVSLLAQAILSDTVSVEHREVAIEMLSGFRVAEAVGALRSLAEDRTAPPFLRASAVRAISHQPGGRNQLTMWATSGDATLASIASSVLADSD